MKRVPLYPLFVLAACGPAGPTAPVITQSTATPTQLAVGVRASIDGELGFRDPDGDVSQLALGFIDPSGVLAESPPEPTAATAGLLVGRVSFRLTVTPTVVGKHQLSLRLLDETQLSSTPALTEIDVQ